MKKIILTLMAAAALSFTGCTDKGGAKNALRQAGYTNIQMTGYSFFGCSEDDTYHDGFVATGPNGQRATGTVCGGIFKGSTIRLK